MSSNRKQFIADMRRLNTLRNVLMHPVKRIEITEEDFLFVREVHRTLDRHAPPAAFLQEGA